MMLTQNFKRRNVAYARYQRALVVLAFFPTSVWRETADPTFTHAIQVAVVVGLALAAGWMYREAVRWWTDTPVPDN